MIEIIPAIDIIDGECVRLSQGDYSQKSSYYSDPLEVAKMYEEIGIQRLHIVDLDGAKLSEPQNLDVVQRIATQTSLVVQFGGGIKSDASLKRAYLAGAKYVICGSVAIKEPEKFSSWLREYGSKVILGADIKDGLVATNGWMESSSVGVEDVIERFRVDGLESVICTDISKDGMLQGPNFELYDTLKNSFPELAITISGGISSMEDIKQLNNSNHHSVIVGKAIYENRITLKEIQRWLQNV